MSDADTGAPASETTVSSPDQILGGLDYLKKCLDQERPFAVITGEAGCGRHELVERFLQEHPQDNIAHLRGALEDPHEFLEQLLTQLGFEPFDSSVTELERLLGVFLQHEYGQGRRTLIVMEDAQNCGPRVLEAMQALARANADEARPAVTFLLTGLPALHRVLDSAGMLAVSAMTGERFELGAELPAANEPGEAAAAPAMAGELLVSLDGKLIGRYDLRRPQLMIGRNEHNDVSIVSRYVSRHHALLVNRPEGTYVVDLKSTNGTYVNSVQVNQQALKDGDIITIGNCRLKYQNPSVPRATGMNDTSPASFTETMVMRSAHGISPERHEAPRPEVIVGEKSQA
jgi:hypothetical protein